VKNVHLKIGDYHLKSHTFVIEMGSCDIVLGVEWLCKLGPITIELKELYMSFQHDGYRYNFQGITTNSLEIMSSYQMEKLLKKGHSNIIS